MAIRERLFPFLCSSHFSTDTKDYAVDLNRRLLSKMLLLLSLRRRKKKERENRSHTFKKMKCDFFSQNYNNLTSTS